MTVPRSIYGQYLAHATGPPTSVGPGRLQISQSTGFSTLVGKCISMVHSPSFGKLLVYILPIKVAIMKTWLHLDFVDWSNTLSKEDVYEQRIPLQNDLQNAHAGIQKDVLAKS